MEGNVSVVGCIVIGMGGYWDIDVGADVVVDIGIEDIVGVEVEVFDENKNGDNEEKGRWSLRERPVSTPYSQD